MDAGTGGGDIVRGAGGGAEPRQVPIRGGVSTGGRYQDADGAAAAPPPGAASVPVLRGGFGGRVGAAGAVRNDILIKHDPARLCEPGGWSVNNDYLSYIRSAKHKRDEDLVFNMPQSVSALINKPD